MIELQNALRKKEIWAVGGGKGGIGKSLITGNIGITLARLKKRVLLVDADLGGANLHTTLGIGVPEMTLSDFLNRRVETIQEVIIKTSIPNLSLVSGAQDFLDAANPNFAQKARLLRHLETLDADYILLDLGAGTSFNILDFFLFADHGILVVLPEPTAIENAYRFIKSAFYRRFKKVVTAYSKFYAHDEKSEAKAGDRVRIQECRPLSRTKRWRLVEVVEKNTEPVKVTA